MRLLATYTIFVLFLASSPANFIALYRGDIGTRISIDLDSGQSLISRISRLARAISLKIYPLFAVTVGYSSSSSGGGGSDNSDRSSGNSIVAVILFLTREREFFASAVSGDKSSIPSFEVRRVCKSFFFLCRVVPNRVVWFRVVPCHVMSCHVPWLVVCCVASSLVVVRFVFVVACHVNSSSEVSYHALARRVMS